MRVLLLPLLFLTCVRSYGVITGYVDMESGTNRQPITTEILNAATHASGGSWTVNTELSHFLVSTSFETPLLFPMTVGGTTYRDDHSTRTFVFTNTATSEFATYTFDQRPAKLSFGLYMRLSGFGGVDSSFDFVAVEANGDFLVVNFQDRASGFAYRVHTLDENGAGPGGPGVGVPVPVVQDKTYWITCLWDKPNLVATLKVYDPETWGLVGTSTNVILDRNAENLIIGRYDTHDVALDNASTYFEDLVWDATGAIYPLFPASQSMISGVTRSNDSFVVQVSIGCGDLPVRVEWCPHLNAPVPQWQEIFKTTSEQPGENAIFIFSPVAGQKQSGFFRTVQ